MDDQNGERATGNLWSDATPDDSEEAPVGNALVRMPQQPAHRRAVTHVGGPRRGSRKGGDRRQASEWLSYRPSSMGHDIVPHHDVTA